MRSHTRTHLLLSRDAHTILVMCALRTQRAHDSGGTRNPMSPLLITSALALRPRLPRTASGQAWTPHIIGLVLLVGAGATWLAVGTLYSVAGPAGPAAAAALAIF